MTLRLFFLGLSLLSCSTSPFRQYHYVNVLMNWDDARHYCREKYTDLALFESMEEIQRLNRPPLLSTWAWIGLRDDPKSWKGTMGNDTNSWRWSATGETSKSGYQNWYPGEPDYHQGKQTCIAMTSNGQWSDKDCHIFQDFICYAGTSQQERIYVYVNDSKTWNEAQTYCRTHHVDLASIEDSSQNTEVFSVKQSSASVWIGLYRVPWTWHYHTHTSFTNWITAAPDNTFGTQHCGAEREEHLWNDIVCKEKMAFLCHEVSKLNTTVRMIIRTAADLTDPSSQTQILQWIGSALQSWGGTGFTVQWKIQPRKQPFK